MQRAYILLGRVVGVLWHFPFQLLLEEGRGMCTISSQARVCVKKSCRELALCALESGDMQRVLTEILGQTTWWRGKRERDWEAWGRYVRFSQNRCALPKREPACSHVDRESYQEGMEGWRDPALGGQLKPTGSCVCGQIEAKSPASQKPWVVGGLHQEGLSNQLRSENKQLSLLPPGPWIPVLHTPVRGVGSFPCLLSSLHPLLPEGQEQRQGGAEEFRLSLLFAGRAAEAGPSWGKVI